jgi:hypothetical protein
MWHQAGRSSTKAAVTAAAASAASAGYLQQGIAEVLNNLIPAGVLSTLWFAGGFLQI